MRSQDFPPGFLWGTATAAHQVEGQNFNNDWWDWEQVPGHIRSGCSSRVACDWWGGLYVQDFNLAQSLGTNAHRLSVEWSRIESREGQWNVEAIDFYREMLEALHERGIVPFVTLLHFTQPRWFMAKGGWLADDSPQVFARFATRVVECLGDLAANWITVNEPNLYMVLSYLWGKRPPGSTSMTQAFHVARNLLRAHAAAYHAIHRIQPSAQVSLAHAWRATAPANLRSARDRVCARIGDHIANRMFVRALVEGVFPFPMGRGEQVPEIKNSLDYFALNYYFEHPVAFDIRQPGSLFLRAAQPDCVKGTAYETYGGVGNLSPECFYRVLKELARFKVPIYITENGMFDLGGDIQQGYLVTHLDVLRRAMREGVDVRGYFWWSLTDNFEWDDGYWPRFGLFHVDFETQARTPRPVAELYARIIRENGIDGELIKRYGLLERKVIGSTD